MGVEISENQRQNSNYYLTSCGFSPNLICDSMENKYVTPEEYFDFVYSIYSIGWSTDLDVTFRQIASYLRKNGEFIFSCSHHIHNCMAADKGVLAYKKSYYDESWYCVSLSGSTLSLSDDKMSTYVNALINAGFVIEEMIEHAGKELIRNSTSELARKAERLPVTFIIRARKP